MEQLDVTVQWTGYPSIDEERRTSIIIIDHQRLDTTVHNHLSTNAVGVIQLQN